MNEAPGAPSAADTDGSARALSPEELTACEARIDAWLGAELATNPAVLAVDRGEPGERRWYVRLAGEAKAVFAVWFTLRQRTLHYETYVAPHPPRATQELFEMVLRRNARLYGLSWMIGAEDALFLAGQMAAEWIAEEELDRALGTIYAEVEAVFETIVRRAFAPSREPSDDV
jgi:hypothetical protein